MKLNQKISIKGLLEKFGAKKLAYRGPTRLACGLADKCGDNFVKHNYMDVYSYYLVD